MSLDLEVIEDALKVAIEDQEFYLDNCEVEETEPVKTRIEKFNAQLTHVKWKRQISDNTYPETRNTKLAEVEK